MTPADFIADRTAAGDSTTAAVQALASVLCIAERQAWKLHTGQAKPTAAHLLLLSIWHSVPAARVCWQAVSTVNKVE